MAIKRKCNKKFLHSTAILLVALLFASLLFNISYTMNAVAETGTTDVVLTAEEALEVTIADEDLSGTADTGEFLRLSVAVFAATNNPAGFVIYMNTKTTNTSLVNTTSSDTIPKLQSASWSRSGGFENITNKWAYSLDDDSETGTYYPIVGSNETPILVASQSTGSNQGDSSDVYFGAMIDSTKDSGTYTNTVVFTIISGTSTIPSGGNPDPDPTGPQDTSDDDPVVAYDPSGDHTVYTDTTNRGERYSEISTGDNRSTYPNVAEVTFTPPQGVTTYITEGTPLTTGLAVTAATAAVSGVIFLIATRRRDDEDEEEEQQ